MHADCLFLNCCKNLTFFKDIQGALKIMIFLLLYCLRKSDKAA